MFLTALHKKLKTLVFSINYGLKIIWLCGDNNTKYCYEIIMMEKVVFLEKLVILFFELCL